MKRYVAEIVGLLVDLLCALTNHAHGCWVSNHGLARLRDWSLSIVNPHQPIDEAFVPYCWTYDAIAKNGSINTTTFTTSWTGKSA